MPNKKYTRTEKNRGLIPPINDQRTRYVAVGCGNCIECRKQKAREWQVRLIEDIKHNTTGKFVTLTFSDQSIRKITKAITVETYKSLKNQTKIGWREKIPTGYALDNAIATYAVRHFVERHRKEHKKSIRHWFITELGHQGTENIHLHGIIWTTQPLEKIEKIWQYGWMWKGKKIKGQTVNYVNDTTIGYMMKYVLKIDEKHTQYRQKILTSPGIGADYTKTINAQNNKYNENKTIQTYRTNTGHKIALPIYWRNKIYTDEQKEKLWIETLNKEERWILGNKVDISKGQQEYDKGIKEARKLNRKLGYKGNEDKTEIKKYEEARRKIMQETRIKKASGSPSGTCFFKGKIDAEATE